MTATRNLTVDERRRFGRCSTCGSGPGQWCRTISGEGDVRILGAHQARLHAAPWRVPADQTAVDTPGSSRPSGGS